MMMKALYITSLHRFSGKTAVCLALGRRLQEEGYQVGYFKPVSAHPWEPLPGHVLDEDADFVRRTLGLGEALEDMVGVVLTHELVRDMRYGCSGRDLMPEIVATYQRVTAGKDVVLVEGGASLREGLCLGVDPLRVADVLDVYALAILRFRNYVSMADACVVAQQQLGERLVGTLVNAVPDENRDSLDQVARPCLEERGIPLLGALPLQEELQAISVGELAEVLNGQFLTMPEKRDMLIEQLIVGAMSVEQMLPRIRRIPGTKAIITGGDRSDVQLVALETATTHCLVLTGLLRPMPEVLRRAEEVGVPVLLVRANTMEAVEAVERVFGKTRLGQSAKLEQFEGLMAQHFDFARLYERMGL
jgi:BioD-like phosphotransacetylase family protein